MDAYGPFPFTDLPHDYNQAVEKRGADFVIKNGTVPWRAEEMYAQLRDAFKQLPTCTYARDNVKLFSSVLSHYIGDSLQPSTPPSTTTAQITDQQGIHSRFETELFDRYEDKLRFVPGPLAPIPNAREFLFANADRQLQLVEPILAADREAVQGRTELRRRVFRRDVREDRADHGEADVGRDDRGRVDDYAAWTDAGQAGAAG